MEQGACFGCGCDHEKNTYSEATKRWSCQKCRHAEKGLGGLAPKFIRRLQSGRWKALHKSDDEGRLWMVGIVRNTGKQRMLLPEPLLLEDKKVKEVGA